MRANLLERRSKQNEAEQNRFRFRFADKRNIPLYDLQVLVASSHSVAFPDIFI